jgi:hypothetical protein
MSYDGFFPAGNKEFGRQIWITDCTSAVNIIGKANQGVKKIKCYVY